MATAVRFDKQQGDAQFVLRYQPESSFDCVHSSHCLEHMKDPVAALRDWWALVKPGGYMIVVVPDEDLYEQAAWPSLFNTDHKTTFRMGGTNSWSPVSHDIAKMMKNLPQAEIITAKRQATDYDDRFRLRGITGKQRKAYRTFRLLFAPMLFLLGKRATVLYRPMHVLGLPIDQTLGPALAQLEIVARKQSLGAAPGR